MCEPKAPKTFKSHKIIKNRIEIIFEQYKFSAYEKQKFCLMILEKNEGME